MTLDELVARVYAAPRGPKVAAFFDYDGTVITGYSAMAFYNKRLRDRDMGVAELAKTSWASVRGIRTEREFGELLDLSLAAWRGKTPDELMALGRELFKHEIAAALHSEVWQLIEAHHAMGHTVVLASSATRFQVAPMAEDIGADHVLCTELEVVDGMVTGRPLGAPLWGLGKARAVRRLAAEKDIDLATSFAYSNGDEDVMFLETVGSAVAVEPQEALAAEAGRRGWPVLRCVPRGGRPSPVEMLRTVGFYGGFAAAVGAGIGVGLLRRSRRDMLDVSTGLGADLSLALAGVRVDVLRGAEYLDHRPAVFVFNHQSKLDPIIAMKLLRGGFTGVAKKEAKNIPGFGQLFQLADVAFVDRGNTAQAVKALEPAVAKVRDEGISLIISPEGTRSATPRLGRFKKGAFHIAMQAGVPMVPIVIRNAGEVMWRGAQAIRAGTVELVVLPPVPTRDWRVETLADHVAAVRGLFVETLANWPKGEEK
ncbi:HAD-IB family hydrolase [Pseudonocardia eucalypti]|uniref:HAD-IB family hydrolase n=1 Tax=Pseudonocardia eucalypti TaxID=648755 RepID=A0ABP9QA98_9PSEU|nr:putative phosphoserine phosphatase/1-acylglycerol-3-phosphate O-acyltransferase [Pseudonocardia eucalypti]